MRRYLLSLLAALVCGSTLSAGGAFDGLEILDIRFEPRSQPLSEARLRERLTLGPGDTLSSARVRESIAALFSTGRYANIEVHAAPQDSGVLLTFRTLANDFVGDVQVVGAKSPPSESRLINAAGLHLGELYTEQIVARAVANIRRLLLQNGFAAPIITVETNRQPEARQVDLVFRVDTRRRTTFGDLILTGDSGLSEVQLRDITGWKTSKGFTDSRVQTGLSRLRDHLHDQDFWQAQVALVGRDYNPDTQSAKLVVKIDRGPKVTVRIEGAELSNKKRRQLLPIFNEGVIDEDLLAEGARNLRDDLQAQGYFDAAVDYVRERSNADEVVIVYRVEPGVRQRLDEVQIDGEFFFDEQTIRERMLIQASSLQFRRGRFSPGLLDSDIAAIRRLYVQNGFLDVSVEPEVLRRFNDKPGRLAVAIRIDEGSPTLVESLQVDGMTRFPLSPGEYRLASETGQPFSETSVATDRDLILAEYFNAGFQDAAFDWTSREGAEPGTVALEYHIVEGDRLFVDRPIVSGLRHTDPDLVDRQILLSPDQPLSQDSMFETQRRLYDLGVFSRVDVALQNPSGSERTKNVLFELEEARRWTIGFGGGAEFARIGGANDVTSPVGDSSFAPRITTELTRINFRGLGHTVSFRTRLSTLQQRALLIYENPRWTGSEKWKMTVSGLFDTSRNVRTFTGTKAEGAFQLEHRLSKPATALYRYTFRRTSIDGDRLFIRPELIPLTLQPVRAALLSGTYIEDRRDDPTDATRGVFNTVDISFAASQWGSQPDFFRFLGQNSSYHSLTRKLVFARTVQLGLIAPWGKRPVIAPGAEFPSSPDPRIPLSERFFAGGAISHRGFPINQAGPRDPLTGFPIGGGAQFLNSLELRFPVVGANIGAVVFHDAGNVYSKPSLIRFRARQQISEDADGDPRYDFDYMVHAVGLGLRYRTPVGPVRVDFAYSVNPPQFVGFVGTRQELLDGVEMTRNQRISHFQFHFSLGQTF